jgi:photosystem II stability/assembly factor-like uncharacterized protein
MVREKAWFLPSITFSTIVLLASFPDGVTGAEFSTAWTIAFTDLKADLRTLACDPLDPNRIYLGTDQSILATSDGGRTWTDRQSFRNDKISLTGLPSEKALRHIVTIDTPEELRTRSGAGAGGEEMAEGTVAFSVDRAAAEAAETAAAAKLQDLQSRQNQADEELKKAQAALVLAAAEDSKWEPDQLTVAEVESIEETAADFVPDPDYGLLAEWLEERGLSVVVSGGERKRTLVIYLEKHEAEGLELAAAAAAAEMALDAAQTQWESLEAQMQAVRAERDLAAAARVHAAPESEAEKSSAAAAPIEERTPVPEEEYISGVTYIAADPANPQRVIAATFDGIYLSFDRGKTWNLVHRGTGSGQSAILCLAIDPSRPSVVFAGSLSGLIRSDNGGMTWQRVEGIIADKVIISLAVHPSDSRIVFVGTEGDGLFQSIDGGKSWRLVFTHSTTAGNSIRAIAFAPSRPEFVWLGTAAGIFTSADGGRKWEKTLSLGLSDNLVRHLAASPTVAGTAYAATPSGVFATADSGRTFRRVTFGLNFRDGNFLVFEPANAEALWLVTDQRVCRNGPRTRPADPSRPLGKVPAVRGAAIRPKR